MWKCWGAGLCSWPLLLCEYCIFAYTSAELIWHLGNEALFHLRASRASLIPLPISPYRIVFEFRVWMGGRVVCMSVWLSFWGYANCYADIIINSLGKQAGNELGFEWVIVFLRCAAFFALAYPCLSWLRDSTEYSLRVFFYWQTRFFLAG